MNRLVVDASVAVKWFLPEPHSINAIRLLRSGRELLAPDLIVPEVGNVLWKKWLRQELEAGVIAAILTDLERMEVRIVPSGILASKAAKIATTWQRTFYDSLYLALAVASDGHLVTADEKLFNALRESSLSKRIVLLQDFSA